MKFDKLSLFSDEATVPATSSTTTYSKVIDIRKCNLIDGCLKVYAQIVGDVPTTGSVTTVLQVSDELFGWTDLISFTQDGNILAAAFLPILGKKRFCRLAYKVGGTALSAAIKVKAGLVDQFEVDDFPTPQEFPPLEDLTDAFKALVLSASAGTIEQGGAGTVDIEEGAVTAATGPTGYSFSVSGKTVTISLTSSAANGDVTFTDALGNTVKYTVTAAS